MSPTRLLASLLASVLLVAAAVAIDRSPDADPAAAPRPDRSPTGAETSPESPSPTLSPSPADPEASARALELLTSTDAAAAAGGEEVLGAGLTLAQGDWRTLGDPAWPVRAERPVYVVEASLGDGAQRVDADVVIAWRPDRDEERVVLRSLATSTVLQQNGGEVALEVSLDGEPVEFEEDGDGARIIIPASIGAGEAHLLRLRIGYDLVEGSRLDGRGGPAGFGLLARFPEGGGVPLTANLGHWLPLLTFDPGPMVPWGDVGAFPVAIWSVLIDHAGEIVTGGEEDTCPAEVEVIAACTWARGLSLRDLSAVWFGDPPIVATGQVGRLTVNAVAPADTFTREANRQALVESTGSVEVFAEVLGPVAWREFDVVAAHLLEGAAGMEFPGLVIIDLDVYAALSGRFGTYVIAHEAAHQWFHALVGNSSLDSPVIDESLAQYLGVLFYAEAFGEDAADQLARSAIRDRYAGARQRGLEDEPPAQPLEEFEGDAAYGPLVYARAPLAWLAAEEQLGRDRLLAFLAELVDRYALDHVSDDELLDDATAFDPDLGEILQRYWFDPAPVDGPTG